MDEVILKDWIHAIVVPYEYKKRLQEYKMQIKNIDKEYEVINLYKEVEEFKKMGCSELS